MITFVLSPDVLGNTRFAFSPLGEVTLSLRLLGCPNPVSVHAPWLTRARNRMDGVDLELLLAVVPQGRWVATSLQPTTTSPGITIEDQLEALTRLSPGVLSRDLGEVWADLGIPRRGRQLIEAGPRGPGVLAEALWDYWDAVIAPYWPRMCAVLEDDVSHRLSRLLQDGLYGLLADLHPDVTPEGNMLHISKPRHETASFRASSMTLVPSVFAWPSPTLDDGVTGTFGLTYPARGVARAWEGLGEMAYAEDDDPLGHLLGRTRAAVLKMTMVPMSTTQIARDLGQSPGSVSQHLTVLREAGLVFSRRTGRSVLYAHTPLATSIINAQGASQTASRQGRS